MPLALFRMVLFSALLTALSTGVGFTQAVTLENTQPLDWQGPLDEKMLDGLHVFIDRKLEGSIDTRGRYWSRNFSSATAYEKSVEPNRRRFRTIVGLVDERLPPSMERYGDDDNPALVAETSSFRVFQVRWPVVEGVTGISASDS